MILFLANKQLNYVKKKQFLTWCSKSSHHRFLSLHDGQKSVQCIFPKISIVTISNKFLFYDTVYPMRTQTSFLLNLTDSIMFLFNSSASQRSIIAKGGVSAVFVSRNLFEINDLIFRR